MKADYIAISETCPLQYMSILRRVEKCDCHPLVFEFRGSAEIIAMIFEMISSVRGTREANRNSSHDGNW